MNTANMEESAKSLSALRRRHSLLLRRNASRDATGMDADEIRAFLSEAVATGRYLASEEAREGAQGILDYWTSRLLSRQPELVTQLGKYFLREYEGPTTQGEVVSESVPAAELEARVVADFRQRGAAFSAALAPAAVAELRLALLGLFKLVVGNRVPQVCPLPMGSVWLNRAGVRSMLDALVKAGLVRPEGEGVFASFVLAHPCLLTEWDVARQVTEERRGFRDIASGWDRGGRQSAALLYGGSQLIRARDYQDLSSLETEFFAASMDQRTHLHRWGFVAVSVLAAGLLCGLALLYWFYCKERTAREGEQRLRQELQAAIVKYQDREAEALQYADQVRVHLESAQQLRRQSQHDQAELKSLADSLSNVAGLPKQTRDLLESKRQSVVRATPPANTNNSATLAEIFVSADDTNSLRKVSRYVDRWKDQGVLLPAGRALPRRGVSNDTVVRYFYAEDLAQAEAVRTNLINAGLNATIAAPKLAVDPGAPRKYVQVMIGKDALK